MKNLSITELLSYSTVRIECTTPAGQSTGTGFFMNFCFDGQRGCPAIVTNKHVVKDSIYGSFLFSLKNGDGSPNDNDHYRFIVENFQIAWKYHPDPNVDLCAMPIAVLIQQLLSIGKRHYYSPIDLSFIPTQKQKEEFQAIEEIVMIGYPNGIWDVTNNQPIFRKGITATHPNKDYLGKKEFLIDAACFPGSSGSPVFIYNEIGYISGGSFNLGQKRLILLGVLYAGPQHFIQGDIRIVQQSAKPIAISAIPNNLGVVIKSENLLYFEDLFRQELASKESK